MAGTTQSQVRRNRLLAGLPETDQKELAGLLEEHHGELREQVYDLGDPVTHLYFPLEAVYSLVAGVGDDVVEVATIGNEGMVGLPAFLGASVSPQAAFCQVPGAALLISVKDLSDYLGGSSGGALHSRLHLYAQATIVQIAQGVACNQLHSAPQRAARWLMQTRDRVHQDTFPLTQQFLAQMLGVRRATVSTVAGELQRAGVITYSRGVVSVLDADLLRQQACRCYDIVTEEYERLLGS